MAEVTGDCEPLTITEWEEIAHTVASERDRYKAERDELLAAWRAVNQAMEDHSGINAAEMNLDEIVRRIERDERG
jgi:hypothetical protein